MQISLNLFLWTMLIFATLLWQGWGAECGSKNAPTVKQSRIELSEWPKFTVEIQNNCPMCPIINLHLKCGSFPQSLVDPMLLRVLSSGDCVVNGGRPLAPMQKLFFNYSNPSEFVIRPATWFFQCE